MNRFEFARATSVAEARSLKAEKPGSLLKAGGIDLLDHLKEHLVEPPRLVDLKGLPGMKEIKAEADGSLTIGPLATLSAVASNATVLKTHRALAEACGEAASPQIRNVATIGGNVLQAVTARKLNLRKPSLKVSAAQKGHCGGADRWPLTKAAAQAPRPPAKCSLNDRKWFVLLQLR